MAVERLTAEDYEDFLDFIDQVFSQDLIQVHFQEDLPMLFGPDETYMRRQYAYRDDRGRIRAAVGVIPYTYQIGDQQFSARVITNVATHYRYTGRGYMQQLLKRVLEDLREEKADFVILHGNRERYRFYGFEMAGMCDIAQFQSYNYSNWKKRGAHSSFSFTPIGNEDQAIIAQCLELFHREPQHFVRTQENFLDFQHLWQGKAYSIHDETGQFCGYLNYCTRFGCAIREILLSRPECAAGIIYAFMQEQGLLELEVHVSPFDPLLNRAVYEAAEYVTRGQTTRLNLLQPERMLCQCLELKRKLGAWLPNGEIVIDSILGRLWICNHGTFSVQKTDASPDLHIPDGEIYRFLFGPGPQLCSPYAQKMEALSAWFPVPFFIHFTDLY